VELKRLFTALDVDNTGSVDAQEFFAGVLQVALQPHQTHTLLEASFKSLDRWIGILRVVRLVLCTQLLLRALTTLHIVDILQIRCAG
jgi:hypothetical protein